MKSRAILPLFYFLVIAQSLAVAQARDPGQAAPKHYSKVDGGVGFGLDYGGIGARLTVMPHKNFGFFGSLGYAVVDVGYNVGAKIRLNPDGRPRVALGGMYGYNGVIKVSGASQYDKVYYGPSIFFGVEFPGRKNPNNYFNIELVIPFRPSEFDNDLNALKNNPSIKFNNDPLPIAFSLGYHFGS